MLKLLLLLVLAVGAFAGYPKCPYGQRYFKCKPCKLTCKDYYSTNVCHYSCKPGCACTKGTYWSEKLNKCVYPKYCPKPCSYGMVYYKCKPCKQTCKHYQNPPICPYGVKYCQPGCACAKGYYYDSYKKHCVPAHQCPPQCKDGKIYYKCLPCQYSCNDYSDKKVCYQKKCAPGCACPKGQYWSDKYKKCVSHYGCPKRCPYNQIYVKCVRCVPKCPANVWGYYVNTCKSSYGSYYHCKPGCTCKPGLYLHKSGWCVKKAYCLYKNYPGYSG